MLAAPPEVGKAGARDVRPAASEAVGDHHRVHRAGRRAGDAFDREAPVLEDVVEHAPGEGAVRAATLKREIDALLGAWRGLRLWIGRLPSVAAAWSFRPLFIRHEAARILGRGPMKPAVGRRGNGKVLSGMNCPELLAMG